MKIIKRLKDFFINLATSGKYIGMGMGEFYTSDYLIRYVLLNSISILGFFTLLFFTVMNIRNNEYADAAVCIAMSVICIISLILGRSRLPQTVPALITFISFGLMCITLVWIGRAHGANFAFIYMFPALTIMQSGMLYGVTASAALIIIISLEMFIPGLSNFTYHFDISIRMLVGYILVLFLTIVVETTRKTKDRFIEIQNRRLMELREEADMANKSKSNFLATMSHEIRTPLNAIIGIAQIQLQKDNLSEEYAADMDKIYTSGNNLLGIINDILDMSKIETGKLELNPAEYDVPSLINDAVQINIVRIGSKQIEFKVDADEKLPSKLYGDELRLKQILNNLLSNAIKYTKKGTVKLSVSHYFKNGDVILRFVIEDTGQGMKNDDLKWLFTVYQRFNAEANRSIEGTGIGLSITKSLVEMMGGTIKVESVYGEGSVFTAEVIQKSVQCEAIGKEISEKLRSFKFAAGKRDRRRSIRAIMPYGRVLVVDDVEINLFVAEGLLTPYQLNMDTAKSGFEAIKMIESGKYYDVIFMDHMMPQMDGVETTKKLRAAGYKGTIVALTANALAGNDEFFAKNGFDGFIPKPINVRQLDSVLYKFIRDKYPDKAEKYKNSIQTEIMPAQETKQEIKKDVNPKLIKIFCSDAKKAVVTLQETAANGDIKLYTTTVHAMKTALLIIKEPEMSAEAQALENAGRQENGGFITANNEIFLNKLTALIDKLTPPENIAAVNGIAEDTSFLKEQMQIIKTACLNYDDTAAYAAIEKLKEKTWKKETAAALDKIYDTLFFDSGFDTAAEMAEKLI